MNYKQAAFFLESLPVKKKWSLRPANALCKSLGAKPEKLQAALVAGTNGKGSVSAMLESILRISGLKTALYTSPHLESYCERFQINGKQITPACFAKLVAQAKPSIEKYNKATKAKGGETISAFEALTAIAIKFFQEEKAGFCVFETGLGGRLDATNILSPKACVITNISLEHTQALGNTPEKIAREKSGILRANTPAITAATGPALAEIKKQCKKKRAFLITVGEAKAKNEAGTKSDVEFENIRTSLQGTKLEVKGFFGNASLKTTLSGKFQAQNAAVAFAAAKALQKKLRFPTKAITRGIAQAKWPGRMEIMSRKPLVIFDGAHNPAGSLAIAQSAPALFGGKKIFLLIAVMKDKDVQGTIVPLASIASKVFATQANFERSANAEFIGKIAKKTCADTKIFSNASTALDAAVKEAREEGASVLVAGSLYLQAQLRKTMKNKKEPIS